MFRLLTCVLLLGMLSIPERVVAQHNHAPGEHCPECAKLGYGHGAPGSCSWSEEPTALAAPEESPDFSPPPVPVETDHTALSVLLFSVILTFVLLTIRRLQSRQVRIAQ
jgi:hypothetical protein